MTIWNANADIDPTTTTTTTTVGSVGTRGSGGHKNYKELKEDLKNWEKVLLQEEKEKELVSANGKGKFKNGVIGNGESYTVSIFFLSFRIRGTKLIENIGEFCFRKLTRTNLKT